MCYSHKMRASVFFGAHSVFCDYVDNRIGLIIPVLVNLGSP